MKRIINKLLPILLLALSSCLTTADLREVTNTIDKMSREVITREQAKDEINAVADAVEERTAAAIEAATDIPTDPTEMILWIVGLMAAGKGTQLAAKKAMGTVPKA
jgi:hypothetical protein